MRVLPVAQHRGALQREPGVAGARPLRVRREPWPIQVAIAVSYAAVCANARGRQPAPLVVVEAAGADRLEHLAVPARVDDDGQPAWFLAAARTIAGPPMSICSTSSSPRGPGGERLPERVEVDDDAAGTARCRARQGRRVAGSRGSASRPACTCGCSVLTRPSRISGKPVTSSTVVTGDAGARRCGPRVPPVETSSTPAACSAAASSTRPVLSETLTRARRTGILLNSGSSFSSRRMVATYSGFSTAWTRSRRLSSSSPGQHLDGCCASTGPVSTPVVDPVDGDARGRHRRRQHVPDRVRAGEVRQQRRGAC